MRHADYPAMAAAATSPGAFPRPAVRFAPRMKMLPLCWLSMACLGICAPELPKGDNILVDQPEAKESQSANILDPRWGVGAWIWAPKTRDKQTVRFWRAFEIPRGTTVARAKVHIGVDNGYRLILDGRELGAGSDWRSITEYDISLLLKPGRHVLAVDAFNDNREAGMLFGLIIELTDGRVIQIPSDTRWRVAPAEERVWQRKKEAPPQWAHAVVVSEFLPREGHWHRRIPTMTVKVPVLRPLETHFWQSGWFQAGLWSVVCITGLLYLRVMAKYTVQSKAQAMLHTERARIARDIHDELGARLTELALEGEVVQTELPAGSAARPRLEALCEKARSVSGAMDEVVWMVNSRRDTLRDFANFACKHAQRFLSQTPIRCRLDVEADLPDTLLELPARRNLLLGVKEALNNAVKYSNATEVLLRILLRGQTLLVVVEDNGAGFDPAAVDPARNGLTNMVERMKEMGGECRIITKPGAGCHVEFQIPLPRFRKRDLQSGPNHDPSLDGIRGMTTTPPAPATGSKITLS
jgi:two-component sensor histidine kinase